jgi:hypothetical protein
MPVTATCSVAVVIVEVSVSYVGGRYKLAVIIMPSCSPLRKAVICAALPLTGFSVTVT